MVSNYTKLSQIRHKFSQDIVMHQVMPKKNIIVDGISINIILPAEHHKSSQIEEIPNKSLRINAHRGGFLTTIRLSIICCDSGCPEYQLWVTVISSKH
jgi:hypothetical protein